MIFYFLISIVFIAEIVLTVFLLAILYNLDKKILEYNSLLKDIKPSVKDILSTYGDLSKEFLKLAPILVDKIKVFAKDFFVGQFKSAIGALTFWLVKKEVEKHV